MNKLPSTPGAPPDFIGLAQAGQLVPGRKSANCVWRWCRKGVLSRDGTRIRMQHVRMGGQILVRPEWVADFGAALAAADQKFFSSRDDAGDELPARSPEFATNKRKAARAARRSARRDAMSKSVAEASRDLEQEGI